MAARAVAISDAPTREVCQRARSKGLGEGLEDGKVEMFEVSCRDWTASFPHRRASRHARRSNYSQDSGLSRRPRTWALIEIGVAEWQPGDKSAAKPLSKPILSQ